MKKVILQNLFICGLQKKATWVSNDKWTVPLIRLLILYNFKNNNPTLVNKLLKYNFHCSETNT